MVLLRAVSAQCVRYSVRVLKARAARLLLAVPYQQMPENRHDSSSAHHTAHDTDDDKGNHDAAFHNIALLGVCWWPTSKDASYDHVLTGQITSSWSNGELAAFSASGVNQIRASAPLADCSKCAEAVQKLLQSNDAQPFLAMTIR